MEMGTRQAAFPAAAAAAFRYGTSVLYPLFAHARVTTPATNHDAATAIRDDTGATRLGRTCDILHVLLNVLRCLYLLTVSALQKLSRPARYTSILT